MTTAVPVVIRATRYRCPFCPRSRAKKATTEAHIARCWRNPAVHGCLTCVHFEPPEVGPYPEHPGWPEGCGVGRDISTGIAAGCPQWEAK